MEALQRSTSEAYDAGFMKVESVVQGLSVTIKWTNGKSSSTGLPASGGSNQLYQVVGAADGINFSCSANYGRIVSGSAQHSV